MADVASLDVVERMRKRRLVFFQGSGEASLVPSREELEKRESVRRKVEYGGGSVPPAPSTGPGTAPGAALGTVVPGAPAPSSSSSARPTAGSPAGSAAGLQVAILRTREGAAANKRLEPYVKRPCSGPGDPVDSNKVQLQVLRDRPSIPQPTWHPPWKLMRVISGHEGWVRTIAVDPSNEWFASSGNDRLIKFWDLATGVLKVSFTGHVSAVRGLQISHRHPYLFSCSEDCEVKCWDLEKNMVVRNYHGHLSGVYCLALHPSLDVLATGGRDAAVRIWDMRTKMCVHTLGGHTHSVCSLLSQAAEPQFISGSMDKMVRLWDLVAGKCSVALTHHKKSIRSLALHPHEYTFVSSAQDHNKVWKCPRGQFERDIGGHGAVVNASAIREDVGDSSTFIAGTDNGYLHFWDWGSGKLFQSLAAVPQPGSLSAENAVLAMALDMSGSRLITGECDKTVKIYREDPDATPQSHPIPGARVLAH